MFLGESAADGERLQRQAGDEMGEQESQAPAVAAGAAGESEEYFEAAVRGSVDELLDAGAHTEVDAMRHSAAHVMAEAVLGIFPEAQSGSGRPSTTVSTTTSFCRAR